MNGTLKKILFLSVLLLSPMLAHAHTAASAVTGWHNGFNHPLHGWDHILTMVAVGMWAAQLRGRAVWLLPLGFVGVMSLGGLAGVAGLAAPAAEWMVLLSGVVFAGLVIRNKRFRVETSLAIVSFFAFFHGLVHGLEMPASTSFLSFGLGFMLATLLLHGIGIVVARLLVMIVTCLPGSSAIAQQALEGSNTLSGLKTDDEQALRLPDIVVTERGDSQVGIVDSASQGNVGQEQLKLRPIFRPGEVLETVPGLIVSQHSGEGKANQYYLRGFNLDHGTDFLTQVDGVPMNLVSHGHGQGYTDTGFVIPELIRTISYQKGVYYAENGDFASAGAADLQTFNTLPTGIAKFTGGSFDYYRGLVAASVKAGDGDFLYALEGNYNDGPWLHGNHFKKGNGVLRYSREHEDRGWNITFRGYAADWNSTDQIARRAVNLGLIDRFGLIDPTDGGNSQRYSLTGEWRRQNDASATKVMAYGFYYDLDLFSNFTYFLDHPMQGDQFEQFDRRWVSGLKASHTLFHDFGEVESETTVGLQFRNDTIHNSLNLTQARQRYDTVREDDVRETSLGLYVENKTHWNTWARSSLGLRFDGFRFDVDSNRSENSGARSDGLVSPKASVVLGPWADTEIYLNAGLGFHSNDARGVNTNVDLVTGGSIDTEGNLVKPAVPLARTYGAEIGARSVWIDGLQSTLALWWLDIDSELVFVGDAGTTEAGRPGRRYGIEWANYYTPTDWLTFDADFSYSKARFRDHAAQGRHIPGSVETVIAAGATVHDLGGFFGGLRLRYFGPRALIEDNSARSDPTVLLSGNLGYQIDKVWTIQAEVFNLLNRKDSAIDYFYESLLRQELPMPVDPKMPPDGVPDIHFHPIEPIGFRIGVTANF